MTDDERFGSARGPRGTPGEEYELGEKPDLAAISEEQLRVPLEKLSKEERAISYRRHVIQGRNDLIRAELVRRGGVALPPKGLARVLAEEGGHGGGVS
jgi:hypothetical protein